MVKQVWPEDILDITEGPSGKFLIKFSAEGCPPCKRLQEHLERLDVDALVFQVRADGSAVYTDLRRFFAFRTLPFCVVTNASLEQIDAMSGFTDGAAFERFLRGHF